MQNVVVVTMILKFLTSNKGCQYNHGVVFFKFVFNLDYFVVVFIQLLTPKPKYKTY